MAQLNSLDTVVEKTPWWSLSIALHTIAALIMAYLIVLVPPAEADEVTIVRKPRQPIRPPEYPPERVETPSVLETTTTTETPELSREAVEETPMDDTDPDDRELRGQLDTALTRHPFNSLSTNSTIGVGGDAAGAKGSPKSGYKQRIGKISGRPGQRQEFDAVLLALCWLARHQLADGAWLVQGHTARCKGLICPTVQTASENYDTGVTALAILAFLGAGFSHLSKDTHEGICFGDVVKKGLQWLQTHQDPEGCVGSRTIYKYMYNHAIAALALVEAYGMTGSLLIRDSAQRAIDFLISAQNPGKGWRYSAKCGDNDSSVTGWAAMVLKSAELSGLTFPRTGYDGTRAWYDEVTDENYYQVGYTHKSSGKVVVPGMNENFNHHEALTAIAIMARIFMDRDRSDPRIHGGAELLANDLPTWKDKAIDFYYWYYASLALFQVQGPQWKRFEERLVDVLVKNQNGSATGCRSGSWEPIDRWSCEAGRVYATAINALSLEVHYRYANVFTGSRK